MKLAKQIDLNAKTGVLTVDGEPFGYLISDEPVTVIAAPDGPMRITLSLLAEHVTITPDSE